MLTLPLHCSFCGITCHNICPEGKRTTRIHQCFPEITSLCACPPARLPATVITSSQSKLRGNLGWAGKKLFEFSISRSASKVWVKIESALQNRALEEREQTTLWLPGLLYNETLCSFGAYFSWESAKLSSKGVKLKDFLHNCVYACLKSPSECIQQYVFLLVKVWWLCGSLWSPQATTSAALEECP